VELREADCCDGLDVFVSAKFRSHCLNCSLTNLTNQRTVRKMTRAAAFISLLSTSERVCSSMGASWKVRKEGSSLERRKEALVRLASPRCSSTGS